MSNTLDKKYLDLLDQINAYGSERIDRTGVGTRAIFGTMLRHNMDDGFPVLTTKRVYWKTAFKEMLWMLSGSDRLRDLLKQKVTIWTEWPHKKYMDATGDKISQEEFEGRILADDLFDAKWGSLGPVYGVQWRKWKSYELDENGQHKIIDQVQNAYDQLKNNPASRRIIIEGWNVAELDRMALPPCHKSYMFFYDESANRLSLKLEQRSCDTVAGLPFNLCNQGFLLSIFAHSLGMIPGDIVWSGGDTHIYNFESHKNALELQKQRPPFDLPRLAIKCDPKPVTEYTIDDFDLVGYKCHDSIKIEVAV